jgi:hypothetical protein
MPARSALPTAARCSTTTRPVGTVTLTPDTPESATRAFLTLLSQAAHDMPCTIRVVLATGLASWGDSPCRLLSRGSHPHAGTMIIAWAEGRAQLGGPAPVLLSSTPLTRAISSVGERCIHTAEVTGSNPVSPTLLYGGNALQGPPVRGSCRVALFSGSCGREEGRPPHQTSRTVTRALVFRVFYLLDRIRPYPEEIA